MKTTTTEPRITGVLVLVTAKPGVTREQVMRFMPAEIRATVRLYLEGTIRHWYSRGDGKGAVFILDSKDEAEAHSVMDGLPLSAENLMDHQFIPIGPLLPLGVLLGATPLPAPSEPPSGSLNIQRSAASIA